MPPPKKKVKRKRAKTTKKKNGRNEIKAKKYNANGIKTRGNEISELRKRLLFYS